MHPVSSSRVAGSMIALCVACAGPTLPSGVDTGQPASSSDATSGGGTNVTPDPTTDSGANTDTTVGSSGGEPEVPVECAAGEGLCIASESASLRCYCPEVLAGPADFRQAVLAVDVDADGYADVIAGERTGADENTRLIYFRGGAQGLEVAAEFAQLPGWLTAFAVGDLDEDGVLDLMIGTLGGADLTVLLSAGGPWPTTLTSITTGFEQAPRIGIGDVDDDAHLDLVTLAFSGIAVVDAVVWPGNGDGTFGAPVTTAAAPQAVNGWSTLHVDDFDQDGADDVLALANRLLRGIAGGAGVLTEPLAVSLSGVPQFADADSDGHIDVLSFGYGGDHRPETIPVTVARGSGDAIFSNTHQWTFAGDESISGQWADVDDDQALDVLLVAGPDESQQLFFARGDGAFGFPNALEPSLGTLAAFSSVAAVVDLTNDGRADLLARTWPQEPDLKELVVYVAQP